MKQLRNALGSSLLWALAAPQVLAQGQTGFPIQGRFTTVEGLIAGIINFMLLIGGFLALFALLYGGFQYVSAGGDEQKVLSARTTLTYAIIGIVIVIAAFAIVQWIAGQLTG